MTDTGDADRGQVTDPGIRISIFCQFRIGTFDSSEWRKYFDDCSFSPMCIMFFAILYQTWSDIAHDNWL